MKSTLALSLLFAIVGCQKADRPETATPAEAQPEAHEQHEHDFPTTVTAYHDQMSPLWHAEAGDARRDNTCAAVGDLIAKAEAIVSGDVPEAAAGDADAWAEQANGLVAATKELETVCADNPEKFDETFHALHEAFHGLVGLVGHERHDR